MIGRASVNIPAAALPQDTAIGVAVVTNSPAGNIGAAYDFRPSGTTFVQPVTISIIYDDATLPGGVEESDLKLGTLVDNWEQFQFSDRFWTVAEDATVDTTANVVSGTTTHFSLYGVIAASDGVFGTPTEMTVTSR